MKIAPAILLSVLALLSWTHASTEEIILRLQPNINAPAITHIIATEKVLMESAPAGENNEWNKLDLNIPVEGYVKVATLTKGLAIIPGTAVYFRPKANSETITRIEDGDLYEIRSVKDEWAEIGLKKPLTTYFQTAAIPEIASRPALAPIPTAPKVIPAPRVPVAEPKTTAFDPSLGVGSTAPENLPPENVVWKRASSMPSPPVHIPETVTQAPSPNSPDIMVSPSDTQAREARNTPSPTADQPHRLLTGILVREVATSGHAYPIRLNSTDGRFIAYVDISGIFIEDLSPYLNQRVVLRGKISPVRQGSRELVIFVHQILPGH